MKYLLIALEVVVGLMLIGVILLQRSKDQGLGLAFGAGMGESLFGSQAVNVLIKITVVLSCIFFLNTMILARMMRAQSSELPLPVKTDPRRAGAPAMPGNAQPGAATTRGGAEMPAAPAATTQPFTPAAPAAAGTEPVGSTPPPAGTAPVSP